MESSDVFLHPYSGFFIHLESLCKQMGLINFKEANLLGENHPQWTVNTVANTRDLSGISILFSTHFCVNLVCLSRGFESGQPK